MPGAKGVGGVDALKTLAISRIYLDNFRHIKAYWVMLGLKIAQVALAFGVNDLDGTVVEEKIGHDAGAESPQALAKEQLCALIRKAGKVPVERDTLYRELRTLLIKPSPQRREDADKESLCQMRGDSDASLRTLRLE